MTTAATPSPVPFSAGSPTSTGAPTHPATGRRPRGRVARACAWILVGLGLILLCSAPLAHTLGLRFAVISGGSMAPTLERGDILVLGAAPPSLEVNDLAVVGYGVTAYVHRVIHVENRAYILQGDANAEPDHRRVPHSDITGHVVHRITAPFAIPVAAAISDEGKLGIAFGCITIVLWVTLTGRHSRAQAGPDRRAD